MNTPLNIAMLTERQHQINQRQFSSQEQRNLNSHLHNLNSVQSHFIDIDTVHFIHQVEELRASERRLRVRVKSLTNELALYKR